MNGSIIVSKYAAYGCNVCGNKWNLYAEEEERLFPYMKCPYCGSTAYNDTGDMKLPRAIPLGLREADVVSRAEQGVPVLGSLLRAVINAKALEESEG